MAEDKTLFKIILDDTDGKQKILTVTKDGGDYTGLKVYWNEIEQGDTPQDVIDKVGGWTFGSNGELVFDQNKFDAQKGLKLDDMKAAKFVGLYLSQSDHADASYSSIRREIAYLGLTGGGDVQENAEIISFVKSLFVKTEQFKAAIEAAKDETELAAIKIDFSDI